MILTGGEDSILNAWSVDPIALDEEGLDEEEDENMEQTHGDLMDDAVDVRMTSPKPRKRELRLDKEASYLLA